MDAWNGWPLERLLYLFLGAAFLLVWLQLTLFHWKGAFRHKAMWGPVLWTPLAILVAFAHGFLHGSTMGLIFVVVFAITALEGLIGTGLHFKGVAAQVGGVNTRNLATGPPVILPFIYTCLAGLGLLVHYWPQLTGAQ